MKKEMGFSIKEEMRELQNHEGDHSHHAALMKNLIGGNSNPDEKSLSFIYRILSLKDVFLKIDNIVIQEYITNKNENMVDSNIDPSPRNYQEEINLLKQKGASLSLPKDKVTRQPSKKKSKLTQQIQNEEKFKQILQTYLPIAVWFAMKMNIKEEEATCDSLSNAWKDVKDFETSVPTEDSFLVALLDSILMNLELRIFKMVLSDLKTPNILISRTVFEKFFSQNRYDYLIEYFSFYNEYAKNNPLDESQLKLIESSKESLLTISKGPELGFLASLAYDPTGEKMDIMKLDLFIKTYFKSTDEEEILMSILTRLKIPKKEIVSRLLYTKEQDRFIKICNEFDHLVEFLDRKKVLEEKQYKLLILLDGMELINIFNVKAIDPEKTKGKNIYDKLCSLIESGQDVEYLCNVITHVNETFWDMEKMMKFYKALKQLIYSSKINWLVNIQNPLLFYMTLIKFFKDIKKQLDYRNNDINELTEDMVNFCRNYIHHASDEALKISIFDVDSKDLTFLDYAFVVADMNILETDEIENLVSHMWDLGRHSLQTIQQFTRLDFMTNEIKKFNMGVFTQKFEIPIEEGDHFQLEYKYTSNSVFMRVLSDIFWPIPMIIIEFVFSMWLIQLHLDVATSTEHWFRDYLDEYPKMSIVHCYFRASHVTNALIKALALKPDHNVSRLFILAHKTILLLNFLQIVIYPVFLQSHFWLVNNLQMLIVITQVAYVLYGCLSLKEVGVILRIFGSMAFVVVVFGTLSCLLITIVAYPIHTTFLGFSQQIEGQIYTDLNLFSDLYQGILTCFEFVFGAVVLVRPYQEQNGYTYAMSFIMMMFSFFGNIMLANMLVAFLTSQFDEISKNAKYLTMNMQFGLINVFSVKNLDTLYSLPFCLTIPALPFYALMIRKSKRRKINLFLRRVIHVVNVFVPAFVFVNLKLFALIGLRYFGIFLELLVKSVLAPKNLLYAGCWVFAGPFLLLKLYFLDVKTMCAVLLDFTDDGKGLNNFKLDDKARSNLLNIFKKMYRVLQYEYESRQNRFVSKADFLLMYEAVDKQDFILKRLVKNTFDDGDSEMNEKHMTEEDGNVDFSQLDLNSKYLLSEAILVPILLRKFAFKDERGDEKIDLKLMYEKFKNNVTIAGVDKLVGFENETLERAKQYFKDYRGSDEKDEVKIVQEKTISVDDKLKEIVKGMAELKSLINK